VTRDESAIADALRDVGDAYLRDYPRRHEQVLARRARPGIVRFAAAAGVAVVAFSAAVIVSLTGRDPAPEPRPFGTERPPARLDIAAWIQMSGAPGVLTTTPDGSVWAGLIDEPLIERILPANNRILSSISVEGAPDHLAADDVFVYYASKAERIVSQVPGEIQSAPRLANRADHLDVDGDVLVFDSFGRPDCGRRGSCLHVVGLSVTGLPADDVVIPVGCCRLSALAYDDERVWVAGGDDAGAGVIGIDVKAPGRGKRFGPVELPEPPSDLIVHRNTIWAALPEAKSIAVIDMASLDPRFIEVDISVDHLAVSIHHVWAISADGGVVQVDSSSGAIEARSQLAFELNDVVFSNGSVWIASADQRAVLRVDAP